jgi:hypothetical protein
VIKFHGISMPEGAALSWPLSDIVIRRKNGFAFRCCVRGCSLLDQRPVSALPRRRRERYRQTTSPEGRIASPGMLLEKFPPMIGSAPPNRVGGAHGGNYQHGRAARGFVSGGGALPVGRAGSEGAHPRRVVPDDGLASQACGEGVAAARRRGDSQDPRPA